MDITHHPLAKATIADVRDYPFPKGDDPGRFAGLRERALELRSEHALRGRRAASRAWSTKSAGTCAAWSSGSWTCSRQPEFCEAMLDQTLKFWMDWFRVFLDEVGDVVDVIMIGDDLAGQKGPLFRPDFYRRMVKPRIAAILSVEQLVVHGDLAHLRFQPGDLIVAVITFALFQGCCCSRKRAVAPFGQLGDGDIRLPGHQFQRLAAQQPRHDRQLTPNGKTLRPIPFNARRGRWTQG